MVTFTDADDRRQSYRARTNNSTGQTQSNAAPPTTNYGAPPDVSGYNAAPPVITPPPQNNIHSGMPIITPDVSSGPTENEIAAKLKMDNFKKSQEYYGLYGDDMSKWMDNPEAYEHAYDTGFFESQNEGMLGGVTEYEKQTNLLKKAIENKVGKMNTQGLTDAQFKNGLASLPEYQNLLKLYGGNVGALNNTLFSPGTFDSNPDTGYDNTGINTFQDTENNPELYNAYQLLSKTDGDPYSDEYINALSKINYEFPSFDENWGGGQYWDDYLGEYYGPSEKTDYSKMKRWDQRSLGEILQEGPTGFGDLQRIYGEELTDTSANPFAAFEAYNKQGSYTPSFGEIITEYTA